MDRLKPVFQNREDGIMTQLVISEFGAQLGKSGERFVIRRDNGDTAEAPAESVSHILITGNGVTLSTDALHLAVSRGITLSLLAASGEPFGEFNAPADMGRAQLRRHQFHAAENGLGSRIAAIILFGKLRNQAANLRYFAKSRKDTAPQCHAALSAAAQDIDDIAAPLLQKPQDGEDPLGRAQLMNREARAAIHYWAAVKTLLPADLEFPGRVGKNARDTVNICINYGYGILYTRIWNALLRAGLDPYTGFLHAIADNKPSLVFDVIEEFRQCVIDRTLFAAFLKKWRPGPLEDGKLTRKDRNDIAEKILLRLDEPVEFRHKNIPFDELIREKAREIARMIQGGPEHKPYIAPW